MAYIVTAVFLALTGNFFTTYLAGVGYVDTSIRGFVNATRFLVLLFAACSPGGWCRKRRWPALGSCCSPFRCATWRS